MGAREDRDPDGVGVLLDRRLDDLLRKLVEARVDHLHPGVAQRPGDDLRAPVVAVEPDLRDHDTQTVPRPRRSLGSSRSPPGLQSGSAPPAFAARASTKSRSESRFRYTAASGFDRPLAPRPRAPLARPAGRPHGPRAAAPQPRVPPGSTKLRSSPSAAFASSQSASSRSIARLVDPQPRIACDVRHREIGAEVEELVLDPLEPGVAGLDLRPAEQRVQLVHLAVGPHERIELRDARAVTERGLTGVAAPRVDPRQPDGLVALAHHAPDYRST